MHNIQHPTPNTQHLADSTINVNRDCIYNHYLSTVGNAWADLYNIKSLCKVRFVGNIDDVAIEGEEVANLVEHPDKASTACSMEINAGRPSLTNSASNINTYQNEWRKLVVVQASNTGLQGFKRWDSRIGQTTAALARLSPVWFGSQICLMHSMSHPSFNMLLKHYSRTPKKNTNHGNGVLLQDTPHPRLWNLKLHSPLGFDFFLSFLR